MEQKTHYMIIWRGRVIETVGSLYVANVEIRRHPGATMEECEF